VWGGGGGCVFWVCWVWGVLCLGVGGWGGVCGVGCLCWFGVVVAVWLWGVLWGAAVLWCGRRLWLGCLVGGMGVGVGFRWLVGGRFVAVGFWVGGGGSGLVLGGWCFAVFFGVFGVCVVGGGGVFFVGRGVGVVGWVWVCVWGGGAVAVGGGVWVSSRNSKWGVGGGWGGGGGEGGGGGGGGGGYCNRMKVYERRIVKSKQKSKELSGISLDS